MRLNERLQLYSVCFERPPNLLQRCLVTWLVILETAAVSVHILSTPYNHGNEIDGRVNMYHVSAQGVDERMINVHYYYYYY